MEAVAAAKMAKRLAFSGLHIELLITDKDVQVHNAFSQYYPSIKVVHCSSHLVKNFGGKIRAADKRLGKKPHTLSSMLPHLLIYLHVLTYSSIFVLQDL